MIAIQYLRVPMKIGAAMWDLLVFMPQMSWDIRSIKCGTPLHPQINSVALEWDMQYLQMVPTGIRIQTTLFLKLTPMDGIKILLLAK